MTDEELAQRLKVVREIAAGPPISNEDVEQRINEEQPGTYIGRKITWNVYGIQFFGTVTSVDRFMPFPGQPEDASLTVLVDKKASKGGCFHDGDNFSSVSNPDHLDWWKSYLGDRYEKSAISTTRWVDEGT